MLGRVWRKGNPPTVLMRMEIGAVMMETAWRSFKKLKVELPHDPAIPFLGIYSEKTILEKIHVPLCSQQHYSLISQDTEAT